MRRLRYICIALFFSFYLSGCSTNNEEESVFPFESYSVSYNAIEIGQNIEIVEYEATQDVI